MCLGYYAKDLHEINIICITKDKQTASRCKKTLFDY